MANAYYLMKRVFEDQEIKKTKKVGKKYVHFTLPNGFPLKVSHQQYKAWNGDRL